MEPILEAVALSKTFPTGHGGRFTALHQVSFQLLPGQTLGIVGESGSGKSTLARAVARLMDVTSGQILLEGRDITNARGAALRPVYRQIQMVFQSPAASFDPRRTIGYSIGESLRNVGVSRDETRRRVFQLMEQCGLPAALSTRYPHEISGGQCQRAAIARALAISPRILLCDEATSSLDVTVQQQIMALLRELRASNGLSMIFICHNLALVQSFCDQVLVMHGGEVVEAGRPDDLIRAPRSAYTRQLVEAAL